MARPAIQGAVTLDGDALGGAYVRLLGPSGEFVSEQYTRDDGVFTFFVAPGTWTLDVRAAGAESELIAVPVGSDEASVGVTLRKLPGV